MCFVKIMRKKNKNGLTGNLQSKIAPGFECFLNKTAPCWFKTLQARCSEGLQGFFGQRCVMSIFNDLHNFDAAFANFNFHIVFEFNITARSLHDAGRTASLNGRGGCGAAVKGDFFGQTVHLDFPHVFL
jgi:hypothetical protein